MFRNQIVLLCGPKDVGKTTTAKEFINRGWTNINSSDALKEGLMVTLGLNNLFHELEARKEFPMDELNGYNWRDCLIDFSENYLKFRYGRDIFGRIFARNCLSLMKANQHIGTFIINDSLGFYEEIDGMLAEGLKAEELLLLRIHEKDCDYELGETFRGDSRSFVDHEAITCRDIINQGTLQDLFNSVRDAIALHTRE